MRTLFLSRNGRPCGFLLVLIQRVEESQEKIMERKSF